jgi:hypothetical protein
MKERQAERKKKKDKRHRCRRKPSSSSHHIPNNAVENDPQANLSVHRLGPPQQADHRPTIQHTLPQSKSSHPRKPNRSSNPIKLESTTSALNDVTKQKVRCIALATHRPIVPLLQLLQMRRLRARGRRQLAKELQRTLRSVFAGVVDVLPVVPEAGVDGLRANGHGAGPGSAAA